jgi:uncharacterized protein YbgA (DUF1722 family)/uncharacterized protein YbbK (DUF523 family)
MRRLATVTPELAEPIRLGVSSCLLGQPVRYDGGHKRDPFVVDLLGPFVEFVPFCPELELGLGVPRETIRLERRGEAVHLVAPKSGRDLTVDMARLAEKRCRELATEDLAGYVLKKDSPSCGMERVKVYAETGMPEKSGAGAFARVLQERFPHLPIEEEGRLHDPDLRERFVVRLFGYRRVRALFAARWTMGSLVAFHTAEKLLLLAHDTAAYRRLGALVAGAKAHPRAEVAQAYFDDYMAALEVGATRRKHVNVLQHAAGHLKKLATTDEKQELAGLIEDYRTGLVPLIVPITLLRHFVRRYDVKYLQGQRYLEPHPKELMLLNHV